MIELADIVWPVFVLMAWSVIYRPNPFWKIIQNMVVGLSLAALLSAALNATNSTLITPILQMRLYPFAIGLILGLMALLSQTEKTKPISYWSTSLLAGVGTGLAASGAVGSMILAQAVSLKWTGPDMIRNINNFLSWIVTLCTISYFIFTLKRGGAKGTLWGVFRNLGKISRPVFMIFAGYSVGAGFLTEVIWMAGPNTYLIKFPGYYIVAIGVIIVIADALYRRSKK